MMNRIVDDTRLEAISDQEDLLQSVVNAQLEGVPQLVNLQIDSEDSLERHPRIRCVNSNQIS